MPLRWLAQPGLAQPGLAQPGLGSRGSGRAGTGQEQADHAQAVAADGSLPVVGGRGRELPARPGEQRFGLGGLER